MAEGVSSSGAASDLAGRNMAELTWMEIQEAVRAKLGVIIPVGATEQHGPHLPLGTDYLCATAVARTVSATAKMIVAPTLMYGCPSRPLSGGGQGFVGTTSLRPVTFMGIVRDVLTELLRHGFRRFAIVNWHYENGNFLYEAAYEAVNGSNAKLLMFETCLKELSVDTIDAVFSGGYLGRAIEHASTYETSIMMHLYPELVHFERAADDAADRRPWYDIIPAPVDIVPSSGVLWKVEGASAEKGERLWNEVIPPVREALLTDLG
jgi:creatinine amidohydrolase